MKTRFFCKLLQPTNKYCHWPAFNKQYARHFNKSYQLNLHQNPWGWTSLFHFKVIEWFMRGYTATTLRVRILSEMKIIFASLYCLLCLSKSGRDMLKGTQGCYKQSCMLNSNAEAVSSVKACFNGVHQISLGPYFLGICWFAPLFSCSWMRPRD